MSPMKTHDEIRELKRDWLAEIVLTLEAERDVKAMGL